MVFINRFKYVLFVFAFFYLVLKILTSTLGLTAIGNSFSDNNTWAVLFPQGWGFFTRDPREDQFVLYQLNSDSEELKLVSNKNTSYKNYFGFSRKSRRVFMEFSRIVAVMPVEKWEPELSLESPYVIEDMEGLLLIKKGKYVARKYERTPWAWAKYPDNYTPKEEYVYFEIK